MARRVPRVLEFALSGDVRNAHLERGARRALVGRFGEGWRTSEFASLPQKVRDSMLSRRTTPQNASALLWAAQHAMESVLCSRAEDCVEMPGWLELCGASRSDAKFASVTAAVNLELARITSDWAGGTRVSMRALRASSYAHWSQPLQASPWGDDIIASKERPRLLANTSVEDALTRSLCGKWLHASQ